MKTIKFTCHGNSAPAYSCNTPGDNSGEYVSIDDYNKTRAQLLSCEESLEMVDPNNSYFMW